MKTILNFIFVIAVVLGFSISSFARNPATGDDPNAAIQSAVPEAGTMVLGSDPTARKNVCVKCQERNNLLLTDKKDNYQPGITPTTSTPDKSTTGKGYK
mgnify:CR=1 FL=1